MWAHNNFAPPPPPPRPPPPEALACSAGGLSRPHAGTSSCASHGRRPCFRPTAGCGAGLSVPLGDQCWCTRALASDEASALLDPRGHHPNACRARSGGLIYPLLCLWRSPLLESTTPRGEPALGARPCFPLGDQRGYAKPLAANKARALLDACGHADAFRARLGALLHTAA